MFVHDSHFLFCASKENVRAVDNYAKRIISAVFLTSSLANMFLLGRVSQAKHHQKIKPEKHGRTGKICLKQWIGIA